MNHKHYFLLVILLIVIDQISKIFVASQLELAEFVLVNSFFDLAHVHNYGAAFSLFSDLTSWQRYLLPLVSIIASVILAIWMLRVDPSNLVKMSSLTLMLAGAMGNMIDRVFYGFVEDFISLHYQDLSFPVFNVADALLFVGVILLIFSDTKLNKKS